MFDRALEDLRRNGLFREVRDRTGGAGRMILINGYEYVNFASNDYLGLAHDPEIIKEAVNALKTYGLGAGASRLLSGGTQLHRELEHELARLKGTEDALVFNSGYATNAGVIPALSREMDVILSDELNHASIIDGCRLSSARKIIYPHCDIGTLSEMLEKEKDSRKLVITESIFSMDGDLAPLDKIFALCESTGAVLYVDDAHATGVLGGGRGGLARFNLPIVPFVVQMGTLSKALGVFGAFIAAERSVCEYLTNTARTIIFSTALPPPVIAAALMTVQRVMRSPELIEHLWENVHLFHLGIERLKIEKGAGESQIIPLFCESIDEAVRLSEYLFRKGIYAPAIRPPTVVRPRIRISLTAAHTRSDIEGLLDMLGGFFGRG